MAKKSFSASAVRFWQDKTIFVTGATGFLGLALVIKIIRDAPCERLFLLVRGGKRRFWSYYREVLDQEVYQAVEQCDYITVLEGDLTKKHLGLTDCTIAQLKACVNIYIHAGCSTKLRCPLPVIAESIVDPSLELANIALSSEHLERFLYVSTAYANSHLHHQHQGVDTEVSERIYPLRRGGGDSTDLELDDLRAAGTTPEFTSHNFPFPYSYAKHLTERVLLRQFHQRCRGESLLIIRPSIIGPALQEPYPCYEIRRSAPSTNLLAAFVGTLSMQIRYASRFANPMTDSTFDEIPVDIVVNRMLMHLHQRSKGCVHAVAGAQGRHQFKAIWEKAMTERCLPWHPRVVWLDIDWRSPQLHETAKAFVIMGTSFLFEDSKVHHVWANMTDHERAMFPLFMQRPEELENFARRRGYVRHLLEQWLTKKGIPLLMLNLLVANPHSGLRGFRALARSSTIDEGSSSM